MKKRFLSVLLLLALALSLLPTTALPGTGEKMLQRWKNEKGGR